ncbi:hypothetical protein TRAPUB_8210 [Trametes pubescens]|uniref:Uncharacterized protein n=1 Tax=Trametes pubescens TaxID=154538 RepID=A0A1M2W642_TRAPU|nr:hypothetical protein TRAPUB_8210 [Trametes pubescens]
MATTHVLNTPKLLSLIGHACCLPWHGGNPRRVHINFLNLYLLEVDLHNETNNGPWLWDIAQCATQYMTNWTELSIIISNNSSTIMLSHVRHWWRPLFCSIQTLRLKDECSYGVGQFGVSHLFGPSPWDSLPWLLYALTPFQNLHTLLINTPAVPYPIPFDIDLDTFVDAAELGAFLQAYNFTPHDISFHTQLLATLPHLRHCYLQYLHWW